MQATIPSANDRPPIDFNKGLTVALDPAAPKVYDAKAAMGQLAEHMAEQYPPGEIPDSIKLARARASGSQPVHEDPFNPTPEAQELQPVQPVPIVAQQIAAPPAPPPPPAAPPRAQSLAQVQAAVASVTSISERPGPDTVREFLDARIRVTLTLQDGTFTMPATAVRETDMAVFVFFPDSPTNMTFVPKPGTQLKISVDRGGDFKSWVVYYPGSYVSIGELSQTVVAFIKSEE